VEVAPTTSCSSVSPRTKTSSHLFLLGSFLVLGSVLVLGFVVPLALVVVVPLTLVVVVVSREFSFPQGGEEFVVSKERKQEGEERKGNRSYAVGLGVSIEGFLSCATLYL
jgi:membrane protein implicated in regulation of membrane protease activity